MYQYITTTYKCMRIVFYIRILLKKIKYSFTFPRNKKFLHKGVTYYSQFESKELVGDFLSGLKDVTSDPLWKQSGAKTKEEYSIWSWNGCGMSCLKMILKYKTKTVWPLVELGKRCLKYDGYRVNEQAKYANDFKNYYDGLFYRPFLQFVTKEFGLNAEVRSPLVIKEIIIELDKGNFVITSVSPAIRDINSERNDRGHLVLVLGYDLDKKLLYFHNPSGLPGKSQEYVKISFKDFEKFFNHRGIIIDTN